MKKIIILIMSIILMLSLFVVFPSAVDTLDYSNVYDKPYYYTLVGHSAGTSGYPASFDINESLAGYTFFSFPIVNGLDTSNAYKFSNFYVSGQTMFNKPGFNFAFYLNTGSIVFGNLPSGSFRLAIYGSNLAQTTVEYNFGMITANDGYFYIDSSTLQIGICILNDNQIVATQLFEHGSIGEARLLENIVPMSDIPTNDSTFYVPKFSIVEEEPIEEGIMNSVLPAIGSFVAGIGTGFVNAFTSIFLDNGSINPLGLIILVFFGIALGYGVIRWITGLFRKESN